MRLTASTTILLGALVLAGCSGSSDGGSAPLLPSAFAAGTCRTVATDVIELGRQADRLGKGGEVPVDVLESLEKAQSSIRPLVEAAEPAYKPALQNLVVAAGLVRLEAKVGSYKPATGEGLKASYAKVVDVCTKAPAATPTL